MSHANLGMGENEPTHEQKKSCGLSYEYEFVLVHPKRATMLYVLLGITVDTLNFV